MTEKEKRYRLLSEQLHSLVADEPNLVANLANIAALLHRELHNWWTGFYFVEGDELVLGPFQGPVACTRIGYGRGVCGTAWKQRSTVVVPDVEQFPGHIACSSASRSEIVVPIVQADSVVAVLDIDSVHLSAFDDEDAAGLGTIAAQASTLFAQSTASPLPLSTTSRREANTIATHRSTSNDASQMSATNETDATAHHAHENPHHHVVCAVVQHGGRYLCLRRGSTRFPYTAYRWEFPGGKVEAGENEEQALLRELQEEMDYPVTVVRHLCTVQHAYPDFSVTLSAYLCVPDGVSPDAFSLHEHVESRWMTANKMPSLDWVAADTTILQQLLSDEPSSAKR